MEERKQVIVVLTNEGINSYIGGLGTYIQEIRKRLSYSNQFIIHFYEIPFDQGYLEDTSYDSRLAHLIGAADIVHANDYYTGYVALLRLSRAKLITAIHLLNNWWYPYYWRTDDFWLTHEHKRHMEKTVLSKSHRLIAVSNFIKEELQLLGVVRDKIDVIHNGAGDSFFLHPHKEERNNEIILGICGRLVKQKGSEMIPRLAAQLNTLSFPWRLEIIGDGPYRPLIEETINMLELKDHCHLLGWQDNHELPGIYTRWDVTLSLTHYEPFGIAPLESLATGTPIFGSIVCGMREYCVEGVNSLASTTTSVQGLVDRLAS